VLCKDTYKTLIRVKLVVSISEDRVPTGISGLDPLIEGGFPKGSLILLAGNPGTGKTIFGFQFLCKGATEYGEKGIYVSFAEGRETLIRNISKILKVKPEDCPITNEEMCRILDFTTVTERGISAVLDMILNEIHSFKPKRLVIDSFSAMAQAFKERIDARIILHTLLGKIVRQMGCTTILIAEVPTGEERIGTNIEEFVADGVFVLRKRKIDGRLLREIEIAKLRGTKIDQTTHLFTLHEGFHVFPSYASRFPQKFKKFNPIPDTETHFSSGSEELDEFLGGGYRKGTTNLIELAADVPIHITAPLIATTFVNFVCQGKGAIGIPTLRFSAEQVKEHVVPLAEEDAIRKYSRIISIGFLHGEDLNSPFISVNGRDAVKDFDRVLTMVNREFGEPMFVFVGLDTMECFYGLDQSVKALSFAASVTSKGNGLTIFASFPEVKLTNMASIMSDAHIRVENINGTIVMYGIKPKTGLHHLEIETFKGYPLPKLTPIV